MADVRLQGVWKVYRPNVLAVQDLSLEVQDGEFVSVLGPSGCGKSSTLRMIAGLEEITRGDLFIGNRRVNDLEPGERDIAMVFENYALLPHMTAYDNIAFPLRIRKEDEGTIAKRIGEISALLDMDSFINDIAGSLGGGQKQRVGIARALMRKSSALLMDEPISHLDADLRARARGELARLQKLLGITTIYVTHDQTEALAMADRIAVMNEGRLQQVGTAEELYHTPGTRFVADFIGEPPMNLLPCDLKKEGEGIRLLNEAFQVLLTDANADRIASECRSGRVWFGVRPKDVLLKNGDDKDAIHARVVNFMPGCESSLIEAEVDGHTVLIQCSSERQLSPGENISVAITARSYHVFDWESEVRIPATDESPGRAVRSAS
jgi:multiple sugar transport system ATP-binding protein